MANVSRLRFSLSITVGLVLRLASVWADPPSQAARLSFMNGAVSFRPGSLDEWAAATLNYPLTTGDHLWLDGGARADVQVGFATIRLDSNTEFSLLNLDDRIVQLRLSQGSLYVDLRALEQGTSFEIDTPNAVLSPLSAGKYRIDVGNSGETSIAIRAGQAEVTAGGYVTPLSAGQSTVVAGADSIAYAGPSDTRRDDWDSWVANRDSREDRAPNAYVSGEMIGSGDLDGSGTWSVIAGYGPTWAPSRMPADWAPYRFGHWAWVEPWGWSWIDDATWGFAPFHYGRWAYLGARWVWLPGAATARPVYAPALVVFVGGSGWTPAGGQGIGWFPLGPREVYIPPYQASVSYVQTINIAQVTNITVQVIQVYDVNKVVYVNRGVPRGMTVVPRDSFAQARSAGGAIQISKDEETRAPLMGMTAMVAPQRESVLARPSAERFPVPAPPSALQDRPVISRLAPPPAPVPFARQQGSLAVNPGRPLAPAALSTMQRDLKIAPSPVTVVRPSAAPPAAASPGGPTNKPPAPANAIRPTPSPATPQGRAEITGAAIAGPRPAPAPVAATPAPANAVRQAPAPVAATPAPANAMRQAPAPANAVRPAPPPAPANPAPTARAPAPAAQSGSGAAPLIATLKGRTLPDANRQLSEARKVAGIHLDFNSAAKQLAAAKQALAGAERDQAAKKFDQALQEATAIQGQIGELMNQISAATQAAKPVPRQVPNQASDAAAPDQASRQR